MEKVGKEYITDMSQSIAPLKNESGYYFENEEKVDLLKEPFFMGRHLTGLISTTLSLTRSMKN